jgi:plasmid stability protein
LKAITLRNLPDAVARLVRHKAATEGISLNRAVIKVLEERLGLSRTLPEPRHHDLDDLAGSWSDTEAHAFDQTLAAQRAIDGDLWT